MSQPSQPNREVLLQLIRHFSEKRLVIVGDAIADRFLYGSISRVSREAPVFILKHEQTETIPGGAANCAMNLAALGVSVSLISLVGDDEPGNQLRTKLAKAGVNVDAVQSSTNYETTTKVRILAGQAHSNRQQVIRIDYEGDRQIRESDRRSINSNLAKSVSQADAVIISDYNYGVADPSVIDLLRRREQPIPTLVDSRFSLSQFSGFSAATPNEDEVEHLVNRAISSRDDLEKAATELREQLGYDALLVTRGAQGMVLLQKDAAPLHIGAVGAQQAVDVTGAGDTVIATFATTLACGGSFEDAAHLANFAGGLVVMKRGTASVSAHELEYSITHYEAE